MVFVYFTIIITKNHQIMLRQNIFLKVDEQNRQQVITLANQLVQKSRQDEGCISYDFFESTTIPGVFMFCETWKDLKSITDHRNTAHFLNLIPEIEALAKMKRERFEF